MEHGARFGTPRLGASEPRSLGASEPRPTGEDFLARAEQQLLMLRLARAWLAKVPSQERGDALGQVALELLLAMDRGQVEHWPGLVRHLCMCQVSNVHRVRSRGLPRAGKDIEGLTAPVREGGSLPDPGVARERIRKLRSRKQRDLCTWVVGGGTVEEWAVAQCTPMRQAERILDRARKALEKKRPN